MTEKQAKLLAYPFTADEIEWRVLLTTKDKSKGQVAAYIDSRAIQKRLDDVLGRENWKNHFITMPGNSNSTTAHICEISIYYPERQEWITKSDGAGSTDIEPIKGGLSNAFKRAASIWNIGRYLYELPGIWVALKDGKYIDPAEKPKLTKHYNQFVNQYLKAQQAAEQKRDTAQAAAPAVSASPAVTPAEGLVTMKIPKNKIALLVSILAVSALAVFCGILVMTSDSFTPNTKYSFTVLLLAIEAVFIAVLFSTQEQLTQRKEEAAAREEIARKQKAAAEKETELKDKTKAVAAREQNLKEQENELAELKLKVLEAARKEDAPSELEQLRRKCEALEKYRSSFPYTIAEGYVLYGVMRTELKVSAYSKWLLVGEIGGQLWAYSLLRPDTQSHKEMLCLAAGTHAPKELEELNLSKQLLWE